MPMTDDADQALTSPHPRTRRRAARVTAAAVTVGVAVGAIVTSGGGSAAAATPISQSVGRFVDGSVGGNAIQSLADLVDARAKAAPDTTVRNPLEAKVLSALDVPLGKALQLPGGGVFTLGVANQIAQARTDGSSYGASGAVSNTGGVDLTDNQGAFPSDAKIDLSSAALGSVSIPGLPTSGLPTLPTGGLPSGSVPALGGLTADIGAVQALAQTLTGGQISAPQSKVATVSLELGSPALGALLKQLKTLLSSSVLSGFGTGLQKVIGTLGTLPASCGLTLNPALTPDKIYLDSTGKTATQANSAVTVDIAQSTITVNVGALIQKLLGTDISHLNVSNFDLIKFLVQNLPSILSTGLTSVVTGITDSLKSQFTACSSALTTGPLGTALTPVLSGLTGPAGVLTVGQKTLTDAIASLAAPFASSGASGLAKLANGLSTVADIGLNVQSGPVVQPREKTYAFTTGLKATPDQATPVVAGQSLVRAIEIDLLNTGTPGVALALGNAAAGPSSAAPATSAPPATNVPSTAIPTGVPAGLAAHQDNGSPLGPIALIAVGLVVAVGTVFTVRQKGRFGR